MPANQVTLVAPAVSDRAAFISAIAASPDDDLPKLVFADWLEEHGEGARAEFIRLQIAARNEANQFPPVTDAKKLARIRELFLSNYRDWLHPVYDALAEPLPVFEEEQPKPTLLGRLVRGLRNLGRPAVEHAGDASRCRLDVSPFRLLYSHPGQFVALGGLVFRGGFLDSLYWAPDALQPAAELGDLFAAEPITDVMVSLPAQAEMWQRIDGPHLGCVHRLHIFLHSGVGAVPSEFAEAMCASEHLGSVREFTIHRDYTFEGLFSVALFNTLRRSPFRRQLTSLRLDGIAEVTTFLTDPDPGFDALQDLSVQFVVPPGEADLFGGGVSATLCGQLRRLEVSTPVADVRWLTNGPSWEKLEGLSFQQSGMGTASLGALGRSSLLPALTHLSIIDFNLTDADLFTLARSPLVERLHLLELDGRTLGDDAVRILAGVLDRGLQRLRLRGIAGEKLWKELTVRFGGRVELTAGEQLA